MEVALIGLEPHYMRNKEATNNEILEAINDFATNTEGRFQRLENRMDGMEAKMVTKEYLDEKLFDLRGDIISVIRKEDVKVIALMRKLREKNILTDADMNDLLAMEPFPNLKASLSAS